MVYQSTVLRRARTVSAHKISQLYRPVGGAVATGNRRRRRRSPHHVHDRRLSRPPHPRSFDVPGTTFFPYFFFYASTLYIIRALCLRRTARLFSLPVCVSAPLLRSPTLSRRRLSLSLVCSSSFGLFLISATAAAAAADVPFCTRATG
ncbi:unnamed protein product [Aphis gossypii]|uniref:Uncharacterized protein n=1 Tax=Aphis gossypii TaxID=80765 RepID=A0A9P0JFJ4_APHGO|nr:unnamed protein product [Aphis gossypii]